MVRQETIVDDLRDRFRASEGWTKAWMEHLDAIGEPPFEVTLPPADDLPPLLLDLAVPHEDIDEVIRLRPDPARDPEVWWLLRRCVHALVRAMGEIDGPPHFPLLPDELDFMRRWFFVYVFIATVPHTQAYHAAHGVPPDISRHTLADLGRNMAVHRRWYGKSGFGVPFWLMLHTRGIIYKLGRLQFERVRIEEPVRSAIAASGTELPPDALALSVHIPEFSGPMTPTACDASFAWAREFFPRHFPDEHVAVAVCDSWLMDDQLGEYLPASSNIMRFQHRFHLVPPNPEHIYDEGTVKFVYGRIGADPATLPKRTTLERAVAGHILAGRHWHGGEGWFLL